MQDIIELANNPQVEKVLKDFTLKPVAFDVEQDRTANLEEIKNGATHLQTEIVNIAQQENVIKEKSALTEKIYSTLTGNENEKEKIEKLEIIAKDLEFHQLEEFFNETNKILN
jgi:hypothetical protein